METLPTEAKKINGFTKWAMVIAIVVVLNLLFNYAISLVYKSPQYEDYMKPAQVVEPITNKADCLTVGGQWTDPDTRYENIPAVGMKTAPAVGYCDPNFTKQQEFNEAQKSHSRVVFIILVILGVVALVLGAVFGNLILSQSFSWGGVLSLIIASVRYWTDADNLLKVVILGVALGALIWLAVKKFGK